MQIVINIPEEKYQGIINLTDEILDESKFCSPRYLYKAVLDGTSLPKCYGRLIDVDEVVKEICIEHKVSSIYELSDKLKSFVKKYLNKAPTILEPTPEYMIKNYGFSKSQE